MAINSELKEKKLEDFTDAFADFTAYFTGVCFLGCTLFSVTNDAEKFRKYRDNYIEKFEKTEIGKVCKDIANVVGVSTAIQYGVWTPDITKNIIKK